MIENDDTSIGVDTIQNFWKTIKLKVDCAYMHNLNT